MSSSGARRGPTVPAVTSVFYAFRDSPQRRRALSAPPGLARALCACTGWTSCGSAATSIRHNLERVGPPPWARPPASCAKCGLERAGGYGGDFATVSRLAARREPRRRRLLDGRHRRHPADAPAGRARRAAPPLVYTAIGLPERLAQLRSERMRRLYAGALVATARRSSRTALARPTTSRAGSRSTARRAVVEFVPFGVDADALRPTDEPSRRRTSCRWERIRIATSSSCSRSRGRFPPSSFTDRRDRRRRTSARPTCRRNVAIEVDLPFERMRRAARGRHVSSRCRCARTRTRARRRSSCRRWRSGSRSS